MLESMEMFAWGPKIKPYVYIVNYRSDKQNFLFRNEEN